jgi:GDP-L-fucose synthase
MGNQERFLDTAKAEFGFEAKMDFDEGLKRTVEWFKKHAVKA